MQAVQWCSAAASIYSSPAGAALRPTNPPPRQSSTPAHPTNLRAGLEHHVFLHQHLPLPPCGTGAVVPGAKGAPVRRVRFASLRAEHFARRGRGRARAAAPLLRHSRRLGFRPPRPHAQHLLPRYILGHTHPRPTPPRRARSPRLAGDHNSHLRARVVCVYSTHLPVPS